LAAAAAAQHIVNQVAQEGFLKREWMCQQWPQWQLQLAAAAHTLRMQAATQAAPVHLAHIVLPLAGMDLIKIFRIRAAMAELGLAATLTYMAGQELGIQIHQELAHLATEALVTGAAIII
jgi:hypothetical protein